MEEAGITFKVDDGRKYTKRDHKRNKTPFTRYKLTKRERRLGALTETERSASAFETRYPASPNDARVTRTTAAEVREWFPVVELQSRQEHRESCMFRSSCLLCNQPGRQARNPTPANAQAARNIPGQPSKRTAQKPGPNRSPAVTGQPAADAVTGAPNGSSDTARAVTGNPTGAVTGDPQNAVTGSPIPPPAKPSLPSAPVTGENPTAIGKRKPLANSSSRPPKRPKFGEAEQKNTGPDSGAQQHSEREHVDLKEGQGQPTRVPERLPYDDKG